MVNSKVKNGELLFVKSVKDGIPNRDPLNDSDARRIFGEDDGRISLSDVSIKRDVRDFIQARFPDGGPDKNHFVFVREERSPDGKLLGRGSLADKIKERSGATGTMQEVLCQSAFDVRVFGAVYSVSKESFHLTGPVQFGWAHSLHPVETTYVQGTVVMPSKDITVKEQGKEEGKTQGTIWTTYTLPFAVFAMPGIINSSIASETGMTQQDVEYLLQGLWYGTQHRQARGRGIQQPLFLLHVEYKKDYFRIGYLEEQVKLLPGREDWLTGRKPTSVKEVKLDVTDLAELLNKHEADIERCRFWLNPELQIIGEIPGEQAELW
ncbi:MAG: type I CRISPR-associated protein Cas7 [Firmicutes bacterium]|jgi:CRISPR-associated protein Csh2|nr:type I CRISPR-associated protein Cas7 [Bacillota bacterium]